MRKNRISIFSQILYGISKETIQRRTLKEVQNLYQTDMMNLHTNIKPRKWQMKFYSIKWNYYILQSLFFAQCHKKENSYVNIEAEPQCNSIIRGRISSQIKLLDNFLKSLCQHI